MIMMLICVSENNALGCLGHGQRQELGRSTGKDRQPSALAGHRLKLRGPGALTVVGACTEHGYWVWRVGGWSDVPVKRGWHDVPEVQRGDRWGPASLVACVQDQGRWARGRHGR